MRVFGAGHERVAILERLSDALTSSIRALLTRSLAKQRDATAGLRDQPETQWRQLELAAALGDPDLHLPSANPSASGGELGGRAAAARLG
jgi:hypothetical protein